MGNTSKKPSSSSSRTNSAPNSFQRIEQTQPQNPFSRNQTPGSYGAAQSNNQIPRGPSNVSTPNRYISSGSNSSQQHSNHNHTSTVRCPGCRRLLQPPPGHPRFYCPCGQLLMTPGSRLQGSGSSQSPPIQPQPQQQQTMTLPRQAPPEQFVSNSSSANAASPAPPPPRQVRCPSCSSVLAVPPNAPVFRCPCGTHLRAPTSQPPPAPSAPSTMSTQQSIPPPQSQSQSRPSAPPPPVTARRSDVGEDTTLDQSLESGKEIVAILLHQRADEMWTRQVSDDGKCVVYQVSMSDDHERRIFQAESKCMDHFLEIADDMEVAELRQVLKSLEIQFNPADGKENLCDLLKKAPEIISQQDTRTLKQRLDNAKVGYADILEKSEMVNRVLTFAVSPFLYDLGHLGQFGSDSTLTWIPARRYRLDPQHPQVPVSAAELVDVSNRPFADKLTWFRNTLKKLRIKWEDGHVKIKVRRQYMLTDSFNNLNKLSPQDFHRFFRFEFVGEAGIDAGGLAREWFHLVTDQVFNVDFGLFEYSGVDNVCYQINPSSGIANELHLRYFLFLGRIMGKALFDAQTIAAHVTQPMYKHLLGYPITERDVEFVDAQIYKGMQDIRDCDEVEYLYLDFTTAVTVFGEVQTIPLKENGENLEVSNRNKDEYLSLLMKHILFDRVSEQLAMLLQGFYEVIPQHLLSVFNHQELELLLCGLPSIDVADWKANTLYRGEYDSTTPHRVIVWFWQFVESLSEEQKARFLQFATGTSRVPVQGFSALQGNDGNIKLFTIEPVDFNKAVFPKAHTCFNRIELPVYPDKATMSKYILQALQMETVGFGAE